VGFESPLSASFVLRRRIQWSFDGIAEDETVPPHVQS
jgi:hypothetical protein